MLFILHINIFYCHLNSSRQQCSPSVVKGQAPTTLEWNIALGFKEWLRSPPTCTRYRIQTSIQWEAPSSAGMCPPRTPVLLRGAGTALKSAKTGALEGSESLSSAGSGTLDDRLFVQCNACHSRDQPTHNSEEEDRCFHGR